MDNVIKLGVNVDHVATVRQARGGSEPDPVAAALAAEAAGADGITIHLREDRRHIQERDLIELRKKAGTRINLEMAATEPIIAIALREKPDIVCLVPEKREELTTEGGLDVAGQADLIGSAVARLQGAGIPVSLFIDADEMQIAAAAASGARFIELHTGRYADAATEKEQQAELEKIRSMTGFAMDKGLRVNAGHGLDYHNVTPVAAIAGIEELNIGHAIIARAVMTGLPAAVTEMIRLMRAARD